VSGEAKQARSFVKRKIIRMIESKAQSEVRATLAMLRRGIGKAPGSMPELWNVTFGGLPETLLSKNDEPTKGEWAVHTALTLYALHQQGKDPGRQCMQKEGENLGVAARRLVDREKSNEEAVIRRFQSVALSDNFERLSWHLRGLVQLLKSKDIPLDYPALTEDLYWFHLNDRRDRIRLKWGQDFYRSTEAVSEDDQTETKEDATDEE
jgi:CRISPR system Cascade subunit CasB